MERSRFSLRRRSGGLSSGDGREVETSPALQGLNHEEEQAQEGEIDRRNTNRALLMQIDFHEDESPEDDKRCRRAYPRQTAIRPRMFPPRTGTAQFVGATSRGHANDDELLGLRGRNKPL